LTSNNVERTSNAVRCLLNGIDSCDISVRNGHNLIDNLLSRDMSTPTHESFFKTSEPKLDVIVLPPTSNYDNYLLGLFANKPMTSYIKIAKELCERYRYNNDFGDINTVYIEDVENRWRRDTGLDDRFLINAYQSRSVNDMKAKVGVLKSPTFLVQGFKYEIVEYPHTREMVSYFVEDMLRFKNQIVRMCEHYLSQNISVSLEYMFDREGVIIV